MEQGKKATYVSVISQQGVSHFSIQNCSRPCQVYIFSFVVCTVKKICIFSCYINFKQIKSPLSLGDQIVFMI